MLDVEEVAILVKDDNKVEVFDAKVNNDKVGLRLSKKKVRQSGDANVLALFHARALYNFMLYTSEVLVLVALSMARFVNVNPMSSRTFAESFLPILSDYG